MYLFVVPVLTGYLRFFVVVAVAVCRFGNLPICQAGVLHSPSYTRKKTSIKMINIKGKEGGGNQRQHKIEYIDQE